jgi:hypothetical protein
MRLQGERIDRLSRKIFEDKGDPSSRNNALQDTLRSLGRYGDLISKQPGQDRLARDRARRPVARRPAGALGVHPERLRLLGARYMTGRVLSRVSDSEEPGLAGITFILRDNRLITVRYEEPQALLARRHGDAEEGFDLHLLLPRRAHEVEPDRVLGDRLLRPARGTRLKPHPTGHIR